MPFPTNQTNYFHQYLSFINVLQAKSPGVIYTRFHFIIGITDSFSSYESYYMSGTSDTEYSSEGGSVEGLAGSYDHFDVSVLQCYLIIDRLWF